MCLDFDGRWNRSLGWGLLVIGFAAGAWLDPWSFSQRDPSVLVGSPRMAARHAQAVVVGMAFLQLAVSSILVNSSFSPAVRRAASYLTGFGALSYAAGYVFDPL